MAPPKTRNEVQSLTGKVVSLAQFISRITDKCAPFFKLFKTHHTKAINWGPEHDKAFRGLRDYLALVPTLSKPIPGEVLYIYLTVSVTAISAPLVRREDNNELPVYYTGKGFNDAKSRYFDIEKFALALLTVARRLQQYFQAHTIHVLTNQPLKQVLQKPKSLGRLPVSEPNTTSAWTLHVDGSSNSKLSGAGVVLTDPEGNTYEYALQFKLKASNNAAEYEALIADIQLAKELGVTRLAIFSDSQLVVNQVGDDFQAKEPHLSHYQSLAKALLQRCLTNHTIALIPRAQNSKADVVARLATSPPNTNMGDLKLEILDKPSIDKPFSEIFLTESERPPSWMDQFIDYLSKGIEPQDKTIATRLRRRATLYTVREGKLYRKGRSFPLLKCISLEEGHRVLLLLHSGVCGNHAGARNLAFKALRTGYYWPTIEQDTKRIANACLKCHHFANSPLAPSVPLSFIIAPWAYCQWGLDFIGKFPTAPGQLKFAIIAVDYNTKWVETEALATITAAKVIHFLWKNIYCRFGIPETIITYNGAQFDNYTLRDFVGQYGTQIRYASPAHPQTNGQVEAVNKIIKQNLKKRLDDAKVLWAEKLPEVLWAIRTTPTESNGESPFCLSFGTEAVIPVEQEVHSERVACFDPLTNSEGLNLNSDLLEERRERANLRNINNKQRIFLYYDARVRPHPLSVGD
ncbi:uncharacterized protein LOC133716187 [Rosa rugosa]|uniref:uncharacterized protein LOC133716187 n=1 Tax=Rosa rugosa TaxID=74645 RepID=UPI002B418336|nr:uncharacterized protein LOC133716187 [Rosa rugosa]